MEKLIAKAYVEKSDTGEDGVLEVAVASTGVVDRYGEIIAPEGWETTNFKKNPVFLWGHNAGEYRPPIGRVEKVWVEGTGKRSKLMFKPRFDLDDPFATDIYRKYKNNFLNAFSVGFMPVETDVAKDDTLVYTKSELLEISAVAVPANPEALVKLKDLGVEPREWEDLAGKKDYDTSELVKEIRGLRDDIRALTTQDLKPKPKEEPEEEPKKEEEKVTDKHLQDILRILNQASSIALKQIKEKKVKS